MKWLKYKKEEGGGGREEGEGGWELAELKGRKGRDERGEEFDDLELSI